MMFSSDLSVPNEVDIALSILVLSQWTLIYIAFPDLVKYQKKRGMVGGFRESGSIH